MIPRLFLSCGDLSGDIYAGEVIRSLRQRVPQVEIVALGGEACAENGATLLANTTRISTVGFVELFRSLSQWWTIWKLTTTTLCEHSFSVLLLIDNPGFNLRLARFAQSMGLPVVYFVPPQVWVWGRRRGRTLAQCADWILPIFPWEEEYFRGGKARVEWVGHPLVELWRERGQRKTKKEESLLLLLPGSRRQEVERYLAVMRRCFVRFPSFFSSYRLVAVAASGALFSIIEEYFQGFPVLIEEREKLPFLLEQTSLAISCAGTVTLEVALAGVPQIIVYRASPLTFLLGRWLVYGHLIGLPNIAMGEEVFPELVQYQFSPEQLTAAMEKLATPFYEERAKGVAAALRMKLDKGNPFARVAEVLMHYFG